MVKPQEINQDTKFHIPSSSGGITTVFHPFLRGNYQTLFNSVNFQGDKKMPTGRDNADFVHAIYCGTEEFRNSPEAEEARGKMKEATLYVPVVQIYTPCGFKVGDEDRFGVYAVFDEKGLGKDLEFNPEELEEILRKGDKIDPKIILGAGVGFAHRDTYRGRTHDSKQLSTDGQIIITYTPDGAKKLAEASRRFNNNPRTWIEDNPNEIVKRVSGLVGNGIGLGAYGSSNGDSDKAFSFAVKK